MNLEDPVHTRRMLGIAVLVAIVATSAAPALYIRPEIEKVPVARLVDNLEMQLKKDPKDTQARFNLARLHAMAYALKTDTCEVRKGQEKDGAWFGFEPKPVPFDVKKTDDAGQQDTARKHLEKAINLYEQVVKEKPDHLIAQLGRAWCIAQRAGKDEAIKEYRKVVELAWEKEKDLKRAPLGFHAITSETGRYLIPLLDADKDKDEIATLKKRSEQLNRLPRPITPIALPLRENMTPSEMVDRSACVHFDADGSGLQRGWTWISPDAGWLVHDPQKTGKITSALQMFGTVSFWCFWENGYQALAALDDDGDGWLRGKELDGLAIWHDVNGNGISEPGEVRPLADHGIVALRCKPDAGPVSPGCAAQALRGVVFRDGAVRATYDVVLRQVAVAEDEPGDPSKDVVPGGLGLRSKAMRARAVEQGGGSKESEAAVAKGLQWMALHQAPDGHWELEQFNLHARTSLKDRKYFDDKSTGKGQKNDTAGAALGVLPFLGAGHTHKATGRAEDDQYVNTVRNALSYLMQKQGRDGAFPGGTYAHGLATIALCEAYGMTADPMLKRSAQAAINYLVAAQDPAGGGWRYTPKQAGDTSVTGWVVVALKTGQMAGLAVPKRTLDLAGKFLDSVENEGGYGYTGPQEAPATTAIGLLCRQYLGTPPRNPNLRKGVDKVKKTPPDTLRNVYHAYYATQVMHHVGGDDWDFWNKGQQGKKGMRDVMIERQDPDGSWDPKGDAFGAVGGRIMTTSLSLLNLEVYYRHAPLYRRQLAPEKKE